MISRFLDRFTLYSHSSWTPRHWWHGLGIPEFAREGNEYGQDCLVWGFYFIGYLVVAYRTCHCEDCQDTRMYNYIAERWGDGLADEWLDRRIHLQRMQEAKARELQGDYLV